jgi:hypothetical protein
MALTSTRTSRSRKRNLATAIMSDSELANLGDGEVAYIKVLSSKQARQMFPAIEGLPKNTSLFSLHGADGTPIALTDTIQAAVGHAMEDELAIAALH